MDDDEHATRAAGREEPSRTQWLITALLNEPDGVLRHAAQAFHARPGTADGILAARRVLSTGLRQLTEWPRDEDYRDLADAFTARGDFDAARLLRDIAAAGPLMTGAAEQWMLRYACRAETPRQEMLRGLKRSGWFDFDPDGPYRGIDGADYEPAVTARQQLPVVVVTSRGMSECITGWTDYEQMRRWVASRGSTGSGNLDPPPAVAGSRLGREECVLAHLLTCASDIPRIERILPPAAFTADTRYDLYASMLTVARASQRVPEPDLRQELARRLAQVPGTAIAGYGGPGGDLADRYRARLTETVVDRVDALNAADALAREDQHVLRALGSRRFPDPSPLGIQPAAGTPTPRHGISPGPSLQQQTPSARLPDQRGPQI